MESIVSAMYTELFYGQTIDGAGIIAASETVTAGVMTLFNGASAVGTVTVGTSLSSGDFILRSDGAGGTEVIVNAILGSYLSGVTLLADPTTIAGTAKITRSLNDVAAVSGPAGTTWTLVNQGLVSETGIGGDGVSFASGSVTNQPGGTISGYRGILGNGAMTVVNAGMVVGNATNGIGVELVEGGSVTNQSGGTISGNLGIIASIQTVTVVNAGSIAGTTAGVCLANFYLGSSVINQSGGEISGLYGIEGLYSGPTVVNGGSIAGNTNSGIGVDLVTGGGVTNQSGGEISGWMGIYGGNRLGSEPSGPVNVVNAGSIVGGAVGISLRSGGYVVNQSGGVISGNYAVAAPAEVGGGGGLVLVNAGRIEGNIVLAGGSVTNQSGGVISGAIVDDSIDAPVIVVNAGTITGGVRLAGVGFGNRLIVDPGAVFTGGAYGGGGVLELASAASAGTLSGFGTGIADFSTLQFDAGAAWTVSCTDSADGLGNIAITGLADNDTIDLSGFVAVGDTFANNALVLTDGSGDQATLAVMGNFASGDFQLSNDGNGGTDITLCFVAGTHLATPAGEVPVERLQPGDTVLTARNGPHAVRWIGHGRVLATRGRRSAATPVIVRKGALANNVPNRDLHVTKGHALHIDDVLIPVEFLVNHRSILWDDRAQEVALYHVELDSHDVLIANGAPAESYRDDGNRWLFGNANAGWHLPPQQPCAPVRTGGPVVDAVWRRLLDRAGPRALPPLTDDPDLHLVVEGERVDVAEQHGPVRVFRLPRRPEGVVIASRDAVPAELGVARDPRSLGVALRHIAVRQGTMFEVLKANDRRLVDGFHDYETTDDLRWTNGAAILPAAAFARFRDGGVEIVVTLAGATRYPDDAMAMASVAAA